MRFYACECISNPQRIATNPLLIQHILEFSIPFQTLKGSLQTELPSVGCGIPMLFQTLKGSLQTRIMSHQLLDSHRFQTLKGSLQTVESTSWKVLPYWISNPQRIATNPQQTVAQQSQSRFQTLKGSLQTMSLFFYCSLWHSFQTLKGSLQTTKGRYEIAVFPKISNPQRIATNLYWVSFSPGVSFYFKPSKDRYKPEGVKPSLTNVWIFQTLKGSLQTKWDYLHYFLTWDFKPSKDRYKHL